MCIFTPIIVTSLFVRYLCARMFTGRLGLPTRWQGLLRYSQAAFFALCYILSTTLEVSLVKGLNYKANVVLPIFTALVLNQAWIVMIPGYINTRRAARAKDARHEKLHGHGSGHCLHSARASSQGQVNPLASSHGVYRDDGEGPQDRAVGLGSHGQHEVSRPPVTQEPSPASGLSSTGGTATIRQSTAEASSSPVTAPSSITAVSRGVTSGSAAKPGQGVLPAYSLNIENSEGQAAEPNDGHKAPSHDQHDPHDPRHNPSTRELAVAYVGMGVTVYAVTMSRNYAVNLLPGSVAALLMASSMVWSIVLSKAILKRRFHGWHYAAAIAGLAGVIALGAQSAMGWDPEDPDSADATGSQVWTAHAATGHGIAHGVTAQPPSAITGSNQPSSAQMAVGVTAGVCSGFFIALMSVLSSRVTSKWPRHKNLRVTEMTLVSSLVAVLLLVPTLFAVGEYKSWSGQLGPAGSSRYGATLLACLCLAMPFNKSIVRSSKYATISHSSAFLFEFVQAAAGIAASIANILLFSEPWSWGIVLALLLMSTASVFYILARRAEEADKAQAKVQGPTEAPASVSSDAGKAGGAGAGEGVAPLFPGAAGPGEAGAREPLLQGGPATSPREGTPLLAAAGVTGPPARPSALPPPAWEPSMSSPYAGRRSSFRPWHLSTSRSLAKGSRARGAQLQAEATAAPVVQPADEADTGLTELPGITASGALGPALDLASPVSSCEGEDDAQEAALQAVTPALRVVNVEPPR